MSLFELQVPLPISKHGWSSIPWLNRLAFLVKCLIVFLWYECRVVVLIYRSVEALSPSVKILNLLGSFTNENKARFWTATVFPPIQIIHYLFLNLFLFNHNQFSEKITFWCYTFQFRLSWLQLLWDFIYVLVGAFQLTIIFILTYL